MTLARLLRTSIAAVLLISQLPAIAASGEPLSADEAHAIAVEAYVYFYPLVTMDITRKQFTNIPPGKEFGKGPMKHARLRKTQISKQRLPYWTVASANGPESRRSRKRASP